MKPQPLGLSSGALALFVSILWGGNVVAIKLGLATFPPFWSALWRFVAAAVAVLAWAKLQKVSLRLDKGDLGPISILGVMFAAQISCLNVGISWTSPAYAVVLLNSHPVVTNLLGQFVSWEEKLNGRRLLGLAISLIGMCFVAAGHPEADLASRPIAGNILMLVSATLLAARVLYTRRLVQTMHPLKPVVGQMFFALPVFAIAAVAFEPPLTGPLDWSAVAAILYQGPVIGGFCFVVWTTLLRTYSASTLSMFGFLVPFFGVFLSAWLFGERIHSDLLTGAALVTLGIIVVTRRPSS